MYESILECLDGGRAPDLVAMSPIALKRLGPDWKTDNRGVGLLIDCMEACPGSANFGSYARIVTQAAQRRRMIQAAESGMQVLKGPVVEDDTVRKVGQMWAKAAGPGNLIG